MRPVLLAAGLILGALAGWTAARELATRDEWTGEDETGWEWDD